MRETIVQLSNNLGGGYKILFIATVLILGFVLSRIIRFFLQRFLTRSAKKMQVDPTNYNFLRNGVSFIIFLTVVIIVFYTIEDLRAIGLSLIASAGLFAAVVGFASQQAFSNIISGIFIVIFKPFRVTDFIKIGELHYGTVEDITLRHTIIRNPENRRVIIPNSVISSETILNSTIGDPKICNFIELGISYDSSIDMAIQIIKQEAVKHPNFLDNRSEQEKADGKEAVIVRVIQLADSSVILRIYVWAEDSGKAFVMKCDLLKTLKEQFEKNNVEIPFPQRTVHIRKKSQFHTINT